MTNPTHPRATRKPTALTGTTSKTMTTPIATNAFPAIGHEPTAALETTVISAVAANDDAAGLGVGVFAGLLPKAARSARPASRSARPAAANDDSAAIGPKPSTNPVFEGRAEMQLRSVVSKRLVRAREAAGLRQHEAARELSYNTPAQLSQWEMAHRFPPASELIKVARLYNTSVDFLLGEAPEMDRDPAAGLRAAVLKGVRSQIARCAQVVVDEVARHARSVGVDSGTSAQFIESGENLLDAIRSFWRLNPDAVENLRGGGTMDRRMHQFEAALLEAKRRQRLSQALDTDLRERLGRLPDGDIEFDFDDELLGDDEA